MVFHPARAHLTPSPSMAAPERGQMTDEDVTMTDVYQELSALFMRGVGGSGKIGKFKCKKVSRRYAFEIPNVPAEADYMKVVYAHQCTCPWQTTCCACLCTSMRHLA